MDPQQKQLLQCVYRALEDAGIPMEDASGTRTGVFFGMATCQKDQIPSRPTDIILIFTVTDTEIRLKAITVFSA